MPGQFYYQCRIRFERMHNNGKMKMVTEDYLIDGADFAKAYSRFIKEMDPFLQNSSFEVTSMSKIKLGEIIDSDKEAELWYKVQRAVKLFNEDSGKEQIIKDIILIHAYSLRDAIKQLYQINENGTEYEYTRLEETPVTDVFIHSI